MRGLFWTRRNSPSPSDQGWDQALERLIWILNVEKPVSCAL